MKLNMIDVSNNNYSLQPFKHKEFSNSFINFAEIGFLYRMGVENENFELIGFPITQDIQLLLPLNLKAEVSEENPLQLIVHDGDIKHNFRDLEIIKDSNGLVIDPAPYNKEIIFVGEDYIPESDFCNILGYVIYVKDIHYPNRWNMLVTTSFGSRRMERLDRNKTLFIGMPFHL